MEMGDTTIQPVKIRAVKRASLFFDNLLLVNFFILFTSMKVEVPPQNALHYNIFVQNYHILLKVTAAIMSLSWLPLWMAKSPARVQPGANSASPPRDIRK